MMIKFQQGDILQAKAEALVNTVNCVGIMGRGIALQFKKAYPDNFKEYKAVCERKQLRPGQMLVYNTNHLVMPRYIINFPTKRHWKGKSRLEDIEAGLKALIGEIRKRGIRSIAIPPLGCGLGALDWNVVRSMIEKAFENFPDVQVLLFEPVGAPSTEKMVKNRRKPNMTQGRAALLCLMSRYLQAAMDPFITLLEIHKLMYFMQEAGEPLRLSYKEALYGPYAENLRHVLNVIEGHFIMGYADADDNPEKQIELKQDAMKKAEVSLESHSNTTAHLKRVADLINGFETPYGMELLSSVHWVAKYTEKPAQTPDEAIRQVHSWSDRKRMFRPEHIHIAWKRLAEKGWVPQIEGN